MTKRAWLSLAFLAWSVEATAQERAWKIDSVAAFAVNEITGRGGIGSWKSTAKEGLIVEVRARLVLGADIKQAVPFPEIELAGTSRGTGSNSTWKFSAMAVALQVGSGCNYTNPSSIVKGAMSQNVPASGTMEVAREQEGAPVVLTFGPGTTRVCFAFPVPSNPAGSMKLRLGKTFVAVPAVTAK